MLSFHVYEDPSSDRLTRLIAQTDWPCVWNETYLRGIAPAGSRIVAFSLEREGAPVALAVGTLNRRFLRSRVEFPTYPRLLDTEPKVATAFWEGVNRYCRNQRVETLQVNSFEAPALQLPPLDNLISQEERTEYLIDLRQDEDGLFRSFSTNHRRNIKRALRQDATCRISRDEASLVRHLALFSHTQRRRQTRNEGGAGINPDLCRRLLASGDGYLMQLFIADEALSSFFILDTPKRAFYLSGGTGESGMKVGASHCLMWLAIQHLRGKRIEILSLGGARAADPEGLTRYKRGFGSEGVTLMDYQFFTGRPSLHRILEIARYIRRLPSQLR